MNRHTLKTAAVDLWVNGKTALHNLRRRLQPPDVDYIVLNLSGSLPEYIPPPPRWQKWLPFDLPGAASGLSFSGLRNILDQIAGDPRPLGVVLNLDGLDVGWAQAQSLRDAISRLRKGGKKIIAYAGEYGALNYFIAAAADTVIAPPPARWAITGLRTELTFLRDALKVYGIEAEVINVSPYKAAFDTLARSDISPEHQTMLNWIMDGQYDTMVAAIADGRQLDPSRVRELIDHAPFTAEAAREHGLIDAVLYEDALAETLAPEEKKEKKKEKKWWPLFRKKEEAESGQPKAELKRWGVIGPALRRPIRWRSGKFVEVIALEGTIIPGRSQQFPAPIPLPFLGSDFAGAETIAQHFREAEKDDDCAAIVFYVDSRGGSALASDLIWREVERARRKKPVVALMSNYAASGGYYVSAAAPWIIAQPLTVTGSIGVISVKVVTAGLYDRFNAKRVILQRGAKAGMYADDAPFTPELRAAAQAEVETYYADFRKVVMDGRRLDGPTLDSVGGGRVWLGMQALEHKLIDQFGDMHAAIEKAKELAKLPPGKYTPTLWHYGSGGSLLPPPFPPAPPSQIGDLLAMLARLLRERVWMIDPIEIRIS